MKINNMKINNFKNKIIASVLALTTVLTSFAVAPQAVLAADEDYYVHFVDNLDPTKSTDNVLLLEGETINTISHTPKGYSYLPEPFIAETAPNEENPIEINSTSNTKSITAKTGLASVNDNEKQYNIRPQFSATPTKSEKDVAKINTKKGAIAPDSTNMVPFWAEIKDGSLSIIEESIITLRVISGEEDVDKPTSSGGTSTPNGKQKSLNFAKIELKDTTGGFKEYVGKTPAATIVDGKISVLLSGAGSVPSITLELIPLSKFPVIYEGSEIPIRFSLQGITPMKLTIVSRQKAVNEVAKLMLDENKLDEFFKFKEGDSRDSVSAESFELVRRYNEFNYKSFIIDWKWEPDGNVGKSAIEINQNPQLNDKTVLAKVHRDEDTVTGRLVAKVFFRKTEDDGTETEVGSTKEVKIPITIIGTGTKPEIVPLTKFTGNGNNPAKPTEDAISNKKFPDTMDVNDGTHAGFSTFAGPFKVAGSINYGTGAQKATKAKINIEYSENGKADFFVGTDKIPYVSGTDIVVGKDDSINFRIVATHSGILTFHVDFIDEKGNIYNTNDPDSRITIVDNSPSKDASFKDIAMKGTLVKKSSLTEGTDEQKDEQIAGYKAKFDKLFPNGVIDFGFDPQKVDAEGRKYKFTVPFAVEEINLKPVYKALNGKDVTVKVGNEFITPVDGYTNETTQIILNAGKTVQIFINGTSQAGTVLAYQIDLTRAPQSSIASLSSIDAVTLKDKKKQVLTPTFDKDWFSYDLKLPYGFKSGNADVELTVEGIGDISFKGEGANNDNIVKKGLFATIADEITHKESVKAKLIYEQNPDGTIKDDTSTVTVSVMSEDRKTGPIDYTINLITLPPDNNANIKDFIITDGEDKPIPSDFKKNGAEFSINNIPFTTKRLNFKVTPDSEKAKKIKVTYPPVYGGNTKEFLYKGEPIEILNISIPYKTDKAKETLNFDFKIDVMAEDGKWRSASDSKDYTLHASRKSPSTNADLKDVTVVTTEGGAIPEFVKFPWIGDKCAFNVPYDTKGVKVTPVAYDALSTVTVTANGRDTPIKNGDSSGETSVDVALDKTGTTTISIKVVAQSGDTKTYSISITKKPASDNAFLTDILVNGNSDTLKPNPFVPDKASYTAEVPEGSKTYTITPVLADKEKATVTINGEAVKPGYTSLKPTTVYTIVVTAQSGKTKTYKLTITDYNLIKKSDKADLIALNPNYGDLKPDFKQNINTYQVFLKPDAKKFEIKPEVSSRATVEVSIGSKVLTAYDGFYSTSMLNDTDTMTVKVTPENGDTQKVKTYTLSLIKNDKKEQGRFKPITVDMINYEVDPIVVDITNYAVIEAEVFNKLKTEYPKKTMIFSGNDYMLKIKGEDIKELVPHTTQYDLSFSFTTPDEAIIYRLLSEKDANFEVNPEPVYLYFDDHGPLPGQMLLTVSLGREYQNSQLFWNYFNDERERIDYYGYVNSNSKGTITVPINHLSTYMVTTRQLDAAENKTGMGFGLIQNASSDSSETLVPGAGAGAANPENGNVTNNKPNPQTGVK